MNTLLDKQLQMGLQNPSKTDPDGFEHSINGLVIVNTQIVINRLKISIHIFIGLSLINNNIEEEKSTHISHVYKKKKKKKTTGTKT